MQLAFLAFEVRSGAVNGGYMYQYMCGRSAGVVELTVGRLHACHLDPTILDVAVERYGPFDGLVIAILHRGTMLGSDDWRGGGRAGAGIRCVRRDLPRHQLPGRHQPRWP